MRKFFFGLAIFVGWFLLVGHLARANIGIPVNEEAEALYKLRETTVHIAIGTGSIVQSKSGNNYLITNWHVCIFGKYNTELSANYDDGRLIRGKIVKESPTFDLCAVKVGKEFKALKLARTIEPRENLWTRGYPQGQLSEDSGFFLQKERWTYDYSVGQIGPCFKGSKPLYDDRGVMSACRATYVTVSSTLYSRPGSSGSPVVNSKGELVGVINSGINDGKSGLAGVVTLDQVLEFMKGL